MGSTIHLYNLRPAVARLPRMQKMVGSNLRGGQIFFHMENFQKLDYSVYFNGDFNCYLTVNFTNNLFVSEISQLFHGKFITA